LAQQPESVHANPQIPKQRCIFAFALSCRLEARRGNPHAWSTRWPNFQPLFRDLRSAPQLSCHSTTYHRSGNPETHTVTEDNLNPSPKTKNVKWKNIDVGKGYYYITGTITEWLPLLDRPIIRDRVCSDIEVALQAANASLAAFVIMPTHLHLLTYLPEESLLHKFCKRWRGRSGRHIPQILQKQGDLDSLRTLAAHANGGCKHATWKEQPRAIAITSDRQARVKVDYIHDNPVRKGLVSQPEDWPYSSYRFCEFGEECALNITPIEA
jgi:putative transposase